jgi:hypothetical protein
MLAVAAHRIRQAKAAPVPAAALPRIAPAPITTGSIRPVKKAPAIKPGPEGPNVAAAYYLAPGYIGPRR